MHIIKRAHSSDFANLLAAAADQRGVAGRVCGPQCALTCHRCGSTRCQCACDAACPQAAHALSSDAAFPIEPAITPLVFEMKRTGAFEPCWSCEGHAGPDGAVWKRPSVWFYSETGVHLRLLAGGIARMVHSGALKAPWRVAVTFSDADNPEPTFALEPDPACAVSLAELQGDADAIARSFRWIMAAEARALAGRD